MHRFLNIALLFSTLLCQGFYAYGPRDNFVPVEGGSLFCSSVPRPKKQKNLPLSGSLKNQEPLLLIHGGPGMGSDYLLPNLATSLAQDQEHVFFYDQRGCGQSLATEFSPKGSFFQEALGDLESVVSAILKKTHQSKITLLGHSYGATLAQQYAATHAAQVDKLILMSPAPLKAKHAQGAQENLEKRAAPQNFPGKSPGFKGTRIPMPEVDQFRPQIHQWGKAEPHLQSILRKKIPYGERERAKGTIAQGKILREFMDQGPRWEKNLARIKAPTLIVSGQRDFIPQENAKDLHRAIAGSQLVRIPKCGHYPHLEQPRGLMGKIKDFLKKP